MGERAEARVARREYRHLGGAPGPKRQKAKRQVPEPKDPGTCHHALHARGVPLVKVVL